MAHRRLSTGEIYLRRSRTNRPRSKSRQHRTPTARDRSLAEVLHCLVWTSIFWAWEIHLAASHTDTSVQTEHSRATMVQGTGRVAVIE